MSAENPTDEELSEVGLNKQEFDELDDDAKKYVSGRLRSYEKIDKLYQIMQVVKALESETGKNTQDVLSSEENKKLILEVVGEYRRRQPKEDVSEFYRRWTGKT